MKTSSMVAARWHPDYSACTWPAPGGGDRCICGGVRYWHAVANLGCDDCPCEDFVPADVPSGRPPVTLVPSVERLIELAGGEVNGDFAFGYLSFVVRLDRGYTPARVRLLAQRLQAAIDRTHDCAKVAAS